MLKNDAPCFVCVAPANNDGDQHRSLVAGTVTAIDGGAVTIKLADAVEVKPGGEVQLFAEVNGKLHRQPAKVANVDAAGRAITVRPSAQPVDCDARGSYRVCVASQNIGLIVGKQPNCTLVDVSPEGLAVITNAPLQVGGETEIDLSIESIYARGVLAVVSERKLEGGKFRYGLRAGGDRKNPIRRSLEAIANVLHRRQVQRLARAA